MTDTIKLKSKRFDTEYPVELYQKDNALIITHTSLENLYWSLSDGIRPSYRIEPIDLRNLPCIPAMFAVNCILKDANGVRIEQIGEMLCERWQVENEITRNFPLTMCKNMAFDRAFIRYMDFEFNASVLYSSSEFCVGNDMIPVTSKEMIKTPDILQNNVEPLQQVTAKPEKESPVDLPGAPTEIQNVPQQLPESLPQQTPKNLPGMDTTAAYQVPEGNWFGQDTPDFSTFQGSEPNWYGNDDAAYGNTLQMNDFMQQQIPSFPWGSPKKQVTVYQVAIDQTNNKVWIQTDVGNLYLNRSTGTWTAETGDINDIDTDDLYRKASDFLGCDLNQFTLSV